MTLKYVVFFEYAVYINVMTNAWSFVWIFLKNLVRLLPCPRRRAESVHGARSSRDSPRLCWGTERHMAHMADARVVFVWTCDPHGELFYAGLLDENEFCIVNSSNKNVIFLFCLGEFERYCTASPLKVVYWGNLPKITLFHWYGGDILQDTRTHGNIQYLYIYMIYLFICLFVYLFEFIYLVCHYVTSILHDTEQNLPLFATCGRGDTEAKIRWFA